jgi:hypothetical protein
MKNLITALINALRPFIQKYGKYIWKVIWFFLSPVFNKLVKRISDWISRKTEEKKKDENTVPEHPEYSSNPEFAFKDYFEMAKDKKCHSTQRRKLVKQRRKANHQNKKA